MLSAKPLILGIGGTPRSQSTTELALRCALTAARNMGADTEIFSGPDLVLPLFDPTSKVRGPGVARLLELSRAADGFIIASPGYHGGISGMVKNALDYTEDMRLDARSYLDDRAAGCITCAHGWQAAASTLTALRSVMHALRAWPTPLGVAINTATPVFSADGTCVDESCLRQLEILGRQVVEFALMRRAFAEAQKPKEASLRDSSTEETSIS
jgi:FMN reductase